MTTRPGRPAPTPPADTSDEARAQRRAKGLKYVATLDGLRALSALGVVIIHTESVSRASIPTYVITGTITGPFFMLFFAISGFVLYRGWARRHLALGDRGPTKRKTKAAADGGADGRTGKYLLRRLIRIYPLYWVVATAALFASGNAGGHTFVEYLQVYTLSPYPHPQTLVDLGLGIVVWTLIIDVVFYVYVAIHGSLMTRVIRALRSSFTPFQIESTVCITMIAGILIGAWWVPAPLSALVCLPLGMWFAVIDAQQERLGHQLKGIKAMVRAWPLWLAMFLTLGPIVDLTAMKVSEYGQFLSANVGIHQLLVMAGVWLFIPIVWGPSHWPIHRWLTSPAMRQAGFLTYGMYLWHPVILILLERADEDGTWPWPVYQLVTVIGSVLLATVTYNLLEKPLSRVRADMRKPEPAPVAGSAGTARAVGGTAVAPEAAPPAAP